MIFPRRSARPVPFGRPDRHRHGSRRHAPQVASRRRRLLHHRPQYQLHQFLHRILQLLRLLPAAGPRRRLRTAQGNHLRQDSGDHRPGRHRRADAGRPASRSQDRMVRRSVPQHQGSASRFICIASRRPKSPTSREVSGTQPARYHRPPARCRPRFHPRRRRGNSGRRRAPSHQPSEVFSAGMDRRASHRAPARHAHHRHHDVRHAAKPSSSA